MISRRCPICLATNPTALFEQKFEALSEGSLMNGYKVVACGKCSGIYADEIPDQAAFDRYYSEMSKYERSGGNLSSIDHKRFSDIADNLMPYTIIANKPARIADVGCATGGLLVEFKRRGCINLVGFDPSENCIEIMRQERRICAVESSIFGIRRAESEFDLILCTSVLEHIREIDDAIIALKSIMAPGARLYLEVPDITRYHETEGAGFSLFSMEHINYFSAASIRTLMERHGLEIEWCRQIDRKLSERALEPTLSVLCTKKRALQISNHPPEGDVRKYIEKSQAAENLVKDQLSGLAKSGNLIVIWGAGTHTLRLLEVSELKRCNIVGIVDSNPHYQGKKLCGHIIESPETLRRAHVMVLISSHVHQDEIEKQLREMEFIHPAIKLYP